MVARSDHTGAEGEGGNDSAFQISISAGEGARKANDGKAIFSQGGTVDEIKLTAGPAVEARSNAIRTNLAGEINLQGRIDSRHAKILRNNPRTVHVFSPVKLNGLVLVNPFVNSAGAQHETGDNLAWVKRF